MTDLDTEILTNASGPKAAAADGVNATQHSLPDQIAAAKFLASQTAAQVHPRRSLRFAKIVPPGTA